MLIRHGLHIMFLLSVLLNKILHVLSHVFMLLNCIRCNFGITHLPVTTTGA